MFQRQDGELVSCMGDKQRQHIYERTERTLKRIPLSDPMFLKVAQAGQVLYEKLIPKHAVRADDNGSKQLHFEDFFSLS
jgi:hypothetical protein